MADGWLNGVILAGCIILGVGILLSMYRAVKGPRFTDRIVAVNLISTITIIIMCLLSVYLDEGFLVDVAIVYALLGFIAVVVLTRLVMVRHRAHEERDRAEQLHAARQTAAEGGAQDHGV